MNRRSCGELLIGTATTTAIILAVVATPLAQAQPKAKAAAAEVDEFTNNGAEEYVGKADRSGDPTLPAAGGP